MTVHKSTGTVRRKPVVLVPGCNRQLGEHPFHVVGKKYIDAVRLAGCLPLIDSRSNKSWRTVTRWGRKTGPTDLASNLKSVTATTRSRGYQC